jgi:prepilin-type N-terminal cleavage/methylation domain-containing protein
MNRRGFTVIELLTTIAVIGVLASIASPKYQQLRKRANAADVVASMTAIRSGAYQYHESAGQWPPTAASGTVPVGMGSYLPGGGVPVFNGTYYKLRWVATRGRRPRQLIQATLSDGQVCQSLSGLLGGVANPDLATACAKAKGTVTLSVDR